MTNHVLPLQYNLQGLAVGAIPWISMIVFLATPFLAAANRPKTFLAGCLLALLFLLIAPFIRLSGKAVFHRLCGIFFIGIGLIFLALAVFIPMDGFFGMLSGPATLVSLGIGILTWSNAILLQLSHTDKQKSLVNLITAILVLLTMTAGPILIGLPMIGMLGS
ncbi:MAG: hypothetical protein NTV34_03115 [Proteobacteria bacterium]|nr:hypothetical protein [Pseudomonadota bacterium]